MNNSFHNGISFWNSRLVLIGVSDFCERIAFIYFYIFNFYPHNQNPFLQFVYFIKFRFRLWINVSVWINTSGLRPFWTVLLICSGFTWVWRGEVFGDSIFALGCIIWFWSEWKLLLLAMTFGILFWYFNCTFWIFVFHNSTSHCSRCIGIYIWAGSGILFSPNFIILYSIRFFRKKKYCSVMWFYDFTIFIPTPFFFYFFGFGNVFSVYDRRTIVRWQPCMGSLLSIIYGRFQSSNYHFDASLIGHWGKNSLFIHMTSNVE